LSEFTEVVVIITEYPAWSWENWR